MQGLFEVSYHLNCLLWRPTHTMSRQQGINTTRVSEGQFSSDELMSKDNVHHLPTPHTPSAFPNVPSAPKSHLPFSNDCTEKNWNDTVNPNSASRVKSSFIFWFQVYWSYSVEPASNLKLFLLLRIEYTYVDLYLRRIKTDLA